jgi:hypothetical protein
MMTITIDSDQLTKLIRDPIIVRIVSVLDIASLSILELLEYNLTREDINYALLNGVDTRYAIHKIKMRIVKLL